jgi:hypothetical protein
MVAMASNTTSISSGPTLQSIPLEIRLQIYFYILLTHPIRHAHLSTAAPYVKDELHHTSISAYACGLNFGPGISYPCTPGNKKPFIVSGSSDSCTIEKVIHTHPIVFSSSNSVVQGKIPTGLLACCKQIYKEARLIPFEQNSFAFVNGFWSGVYTARQFSRSLDLWQNGAMRWVAVDVLGRELVETGLGLRGEADKGREWSELCILWKGVWGLKLGIKGKVALNKKAEIDGSSGWNGEMASDKVSSVFDRSSDLRSQYEHILNTDLDWIPHGLLSMKSLRCIEIEIEDRDISRDTKLSFCKSLGRLLNKRGDRGANWSGDIKVVFVERVRVFEELKRAFSGYGGYCFFY